MPDRGMAMNASDSVFVRGASRDYVVYEVSVTVETSLLQYVRIARLDHDGLVKVLHREALGMVVAVEAFGDVLRDGLVR